MSSSRMRVKKEDVMKKKIPSNPKYKNVEAVVDSGSSMTRYMRKLEEIRSNYRYRPDELFKRMKVNTFVQLIIQVSSVEGDVFFDNFSEDNKHPGDTSRPTTQQSDVTITDGGEDTSRLNGEFTSRTDVTVTESRADTARSTLQELITGVGEFDMNSLPEQSKEISIKQLNSEPDRNIADSCPFLILDVREKDEFAKCHVISAESFPMALLSRSCNYESKSMLAFKNQPGKVIVLYDDDERLAPKAASTLCERGYDNLFLLSGGLKVAYKLYPNGLITGSVPDHIMEGKKSEDRGPANQALFTRDNIFSLLDSIETPSTANSRSRMSNASTRASDRASSMRSQASTPGAAVHKKPFR